MKQLFEQKPEPQPKVGFFQRLAEKNGEEDSEFFWREIGAYDPPNPQWTIAAGASWLRWGLGIDSERCVGYNAGTSYATPDYLTIMLKLGPFYLSFVREWNQAIVHVKKAGQ
jgi:hypothetical protein